MNKSDSNNFRGLSLSYLLGKNFNNVNLSKFQENLCTSELQFGLERSSSTNMCTMILKEVFFHYLNKGGPVFVLLLTLARRLIVNYRKLFRFVN